VVDADQSHALPVVVGLKIPPRPGGSDDAMEAHKYVDKKKLKEISNVLRSHKYTGKIHLNYPQKIRPVDYADVAGQIVADPPVIIVAHSNDPDFTSKFGGGYDFRQNMIIISEKDARANGEKWVASILVHEATHAIQDKAGENLLQMEAEVAAHIAQAVCMLGLHVPFPEDFEVLQAAKPLAKKMRHGKKVTEEDCKDLLKVAARYYGNGSYNCDGVM
jgi:hypothetical protein